MDGAGKALASRRSASSQPLSHADRHNVTRMQSIPEPSGGPRPVLTRSLRCGPPTGITPVPGTAQVELLSQGATSWVYADLAASPRQAFKISQDMRLLRKDHDTHIRLNAAFDAAASIMKRRRKPLTLPYVPICFSWHSDIYTSHVAALFEGQAQLPHPSPGFAMEYIRPLHQHYARYLIKRHLPAGAQDQALSGVETTHNIVRVYLGAVKPPVNDRPRICLHDVPVYLDQLRQERVDFDQMAAAMGSALAILHWSCGLDAAGVHFMLGCDQRGRIQLWLLDFAGCRSFDKSTHHARTRLVSAIMDNGDVWPRWIDGWPFTHVWSAFRKAYLEMSQLVFLDNSSADSTKAYLPLVFLQSLANKRGPELNS